MPIGGMQMIPVKTVQSTTSAALTYATNDNNHPANTSLNQTATNQSTAMQDATTNCQTAANETANSAIASFQGDYSLAHQSAQLQQPSQQSKSKARN